MSLAFKLATVSLVAFVFGFSAVATNVLALYKAGQILTGNWALSNFGALLLLIPTAVGMNAVLWYLITELSSVYEFGARPRRTYL